MNRVDFELPESSQGKQRSIYNTPSTNLHRGGSPTDIAGCRSLVTIILILRKIREYEWIFLASENFNYLAILQNFCYKYKLSWFMLLLRQGVLLGFFYLFNIHYWNILEKRRNTEIFTLLVISSNVNVISQSNYDSLDTSKDKNVICVLSWDNLLPWNFLVVLYCMRIPLDVASWLLMYNQGCLFWNSRMLKNNLTCLFIEIKVFWNRWWLNQYTYNACKMHFASAK